MSAQSAGDVVTFWREVGSEGWYRKDPALDETIRDRFAALREDALAGRLESWRTSAEGRLALIILLDQFSRNLFRGDARAFEADGAALALAREAVAAGDLAAFDGPIGQFLILPFMHSESLDDQQRCVELIARHHPANLPYALEHRRVIEQFGRFPHRNGVLGRQTSPAEAAFLEAGGFSG